MMTVAEAKIMASGSEAGASRAAGAPTVGHAHRPTSLLRLLVGAAILLGAMAAVHFSPVRSWLNHPEQLRRTLASMGLWGYPACVIAIAVLVGCGVPRILLCGVGGMLLGFWYGFAVAQAGTLLGYYVVFLFIRWGGRGWVLHRWPKLQKWAGHLRKQGVMGVVLIRQLPIHGTLTNLCLSVSNVRHRHFLLGTAIGLVPEAVPSTLVGTSLEKSSLRDSAGYLMAAVVVFALMWLLGRRLLKVMRKSESAAEVIELSDDATGQAEAPADIPPGHP